MTFSQWLSLLVSPRRAKSRKRLQVAAAVETFEERILLSAANVVALELTTAAGDDTQLVDFQFELTSGQADFTEFGVFLFDADGTVDGIAPGEEGFGDAVLESSSRRMLMSQGAALESLAETAFAGGSRIGVYFCQDAETFGDRNHIGFETTSENTLRLGWDVFPPIYLDAGPPSPRWFDDAVFQVTSSEPVLNEIQSASLTMFVDSEEVDLDANIGVESDGAMQRAFTTDASGQVMFNVSDPVTLGEFFEIWRTNAGQAGNNPDAVLSSTQLFDNTADAENTVQMFVNGEINRDFENYIVQPGDDIVLVFGSNPVVSMNTNFGSIVLELFPEETPITVDNFLNYVNGTTQNGGSYDSTFFHRSAKNSSGEDFVIQAGGFATPSEIFTDVSQFLPRIVTDPEITNEPGISNLRGTVAMAKLGGDPNSATSQFFINLNDDNTFLDDPANNEFTVFAQVLGMTTADEIADLPRRDVRDPEDNDTSAFNEVPITEDDELAVIESFAGQGSLTGVKFLDTNQDGDQDAGEAGIEGITIYIDANNNGVFDAGELSTSTAADGRYLLQADPGTHILRAELSSGASQTGPLSPDSYEVDVLLGRVFADLDFGEF